jgi:mannose/fructose/N-acetylgalactosamine-specific phosphotransferase system component IIB
VPFSLVRVDDRLIHGQVTVAWGSFLSPDRILLVNDEVAACDWRCELYEDTDTMGVPISILSVKDFGEQLKAGAWNTERVLLVVENPTDLLRVMHSGLEVATANIGGMHHSEGKRELLPYVFVDDRDVAALKEIMASGTRLEARDVPQAQPQDLSVLLGASEET